MSSKFKYLEHPVGLVADAYRHLGAAGKGVLLAVSGGADSTALLIATARLADPLRIRAEVACLDHGLRPSAPDEVRWVGSLAERLGLPFHTRALSLTTGPGVESRARGARYAALEEIRASRGLDFVATAHTANDQAETLLLRLARGASLRGAAGILERAGNVIRPMLSLERKEIEAFLRREGQSFCEDEMNADLRFARVRVRREVLPSLERAVGANVTSHLSRFATLARADDELLSRMAEEARARLALPDGSLDLVGLRALELPLRRRVVASLVESAGAPVDAELIERALSAIDAGRTAGLSRGLELLAQSGAVRVVPTRPAEKRQAEPKWLELERPVDDLASGLTFTLSRQAVGPLSFPVNGAAFPLSVRHRLPGDRVGSKKLQDVLVNARVRREDRDRVPLVCDASGRIVWVVGFWPRKKAAPNGRDPLYVSAAPIPGSRAHEWLVRYRLPGR